MRKHTKEFKSSISTFGRELDSKITVLGTELILEKEDLFSITPITNSTLLKTVMKEVDFESKKQIGIGQEINVKSGVKVNGEYEYIDYGNYFVYKSEYRAETDSYSHICYDRMLNTMIDYVSLDITYPINLREYITAIATKCGLEFADKNSAFANYNTSINEDHFSNGNYTFRDVLDYIAQLVGGWLCINDNDELEIRYPELAKNYDKVSGENVSFISNVEDEINTIIVDGKSVQETTTGKNLFSGDYSQFDSQGGTGSTYGYFKLEEGTQHTLTMIAKNDFTPTSTTFIGFTSTGGDGSGALNWVVYQGLGAITKGTKLIKTSQLGYVSIYSKNADTLKKFTDNFDIQLEKGSTSTDYEPYTGGQHSPSPDYPSEIESVGYENLFDISKISENTYLTPDNESGTSSFSNVSDYIKVKANENYKLSFNYDSLANSNNRAICYYDTNKTFLIGGNYSPPNKEIIITPKENGYIRFTYDINCYDVQLEKGTQQHSYIPYGKYGIEVKNTGKNLFDGTGWRPVQSDDGFPKPATGATIVSSDANNISFTSKQRTYAGVESGFINVKANETYMFSAKFTTPTNRFFITQYDENKIRISTLNYANVTTLQNTSFTTTNDGYITIAFTNTTNEQTTYKIENIQLEKGSTSTAYEPYQSSSLLFQLDQPLRSLPNGVKDELVIENGRAKIIKKVGKIVLDGSESWQVTSRSNGYQFQTRNSLGKIIPDTEIGMLSNYFKGIKFSDRDSINESIYAYNADTDIRILTNVASTTANFKTWLSTHNTQVDYELAEPYTETIGEVETLSTFKGVNNVSLVANMQTNMTITYPTEYEELDKHFLKDVNVSFSKKYGAVNSVVFSRGNGSDNIYRKDNASINKNGLTEIKIADNPFLEGDDRENFIQSLFDKINGLEFYIMDVASTGIMYLELGDFYYFNMVEEKPSLKSGLVKSGMRKAQGSSGGKFLCLLMNDEIKITQGLEESIYSDEPDITETDYKTASITDTSIKNAIIQTNKNSAEILLKVNSDEVVSAINLSPEKIKISSAKLDIDAIATFTNSKLAEAGSTVINGENITTGTLSANRISGGTISASTIDLKGTVLTPTSSSIGGLNVESGIISNDRMGLDTVNGVVKVFNANGGSMILSNAARLSATAGIGLTSNSNGNVSAPSVNLDLKACSGAKVYLGSMINADGTDERSGITCSNGVLSFRSTGYCTYNGTTVFGSSSKATKENIEDLSQEQKEEVYELIKNIPTKQYDYKKEYGKPFNYGFVIEDIENTKLKELLHITQAENNKDIKMYSTEDLVRLQLIVIQELMRKVENLEKKESENNAKD